LNIRKKIIH